MVASATYDIVAYGMPPYEGGTWSQGVDLKG
jgi:hypothetical protein